MYKVATWNVNSVRKRIDHLCNWLLASEIDIALLQEIKCTEDQFPYQDLEKLGYHCHVHGQKSRNGVAIISRYPIVSNVITSMSKFHNKEVKTPKLGSQINLFQNDISNNSTDTNEIIDEESRYIEAVISCCGSNIRVASVYVPNGQDIESNLFQYKLSFFDKLRERMNYLLDNEEVIIVGGDYNVAPNKIDVYSPEHLAGTICFNINEQEKFRSIINLGFTDAFRVSNAQEQKFSWWNYKAGAWKQNKGMRIDHMLLSPQATDQIQSCIIDETLRGLDVPSDHTPVVCTMN